MAGLCALLAPSPGRRILAATRRVPGSLALVAICGWAGACTSTSGEDGPIKVVRKGKAKTGMFAVIDAGKNRGLKMGDSVCFKDKAGKEIACGKVSTLRESAAGVTLEAAEAKKVKVGGIALAATAAKPATVASEPVAPEPKAPAKPAAPDGEDDEGEPIEPADQKPDVAGALASRLRIHYVYGFQNAVAYESVAFNQKARDDAKKAPWSSTKSVVEPAFGLKLAYHKPLSPKLEVAPALFYSANNDFAAEARFDPLVTKSVVKTLTVGTEMGLAVDAGYLLLGGGSYRVVGLGGLSILNSKISLDATLDDASTLKTFTILAYESYLYVLGLDLGVSAEYKLGSFLLAFDVNAVVPLTVLKEGDSGYVDFTDADFGAADFHLEAVKEGVNHRKSSLGYGVAFGAGYEF